jgi:hypothetical protein
MLFENDRQFLYDSPDLAPNAITTLRSEKKGVVNACRQNLIGDDKIFYSTGRRMAETVINISRLSFFGHYNIADERGFYFCSTRIARSCIVIF